MAVASGPNVVEDGLVLALDARNTKSYPGSGTTWTDLMGNTNVTLTNGPTYSSDNGGAIVFDGTNDYVVTSTSITPSGTNLFTYSAWIYIDTISGSFGTDIKAAVLFSGDAFDRAELVLKTDTNTAGPPDRITFTRYGGNTTGSCNVEVDMSVGVWYNITLVRDGASSQKVYQNGVQIGTGDVSNSFTADTMKIGGAPSSSTYSGHFAGKMSNILYYDRALTASEVLQNYNATKNRYNFVWSLPVTGTVFDFTGGSLPSGMYQDSDGPTVTWGANSVELAGNAPNDGASYPLRVATSFTGDYLFQLSTRIDLDPSGSNWCSDAGIGLFNTAYNTSDWTWKWGALSGRIAAQNDCKKPSLYGHTNATGMTSPNGGNVLITPYVADGGWVTMHLYHEPSQSRTRYKVTLGSNDWDASGTQIGDAPNSGVLQVSDSFSGTYYVGIGADDDDDECHMSAFRYVAL